jgi:hypothetical protein
VYHIGTTFTEENFVMKTLLTALAVTAILATSAVAKTQKTKATRVQPNHAQVQTSAIQRNDALCDFHYPQTDPVPSQPSLLAQPSRRGSSAAAPAVDGAV